MKTGGVKWVEGDSVLVCGIFSSFQLFFFFNAFFTPVGFFFVTKN